MNKKEKSIGVNALLNAIKTILSVIFPLITYPYAARVIQVENIGKVDFSNSVVSYFVLIAGLGISTYAIREGSRIRDNKKALEKFSSEIFTINFYSTCIAAILLGLFTCIVPKFHSYYLLILVQSITIWGNLLGVNWIYSINEDYVYITIRSLIVHFIALVLLFVFVHDQEDYILYAATSVIANVGANVFNFIYARRQVKFRLTRQLNLKKHLLPVLIIFASAVTTTIYVNSDKTILGFLSDEYHVGLYSTSVNVYSVLKNCIAAIVLVLLPRLSNILANGRTSEYQKVTSEVFNSLLMILFPVIVGVIVTSNSIIWIVGGENYMPAVTSLQLLSIGLIFSIVGIFYSNAVLLPMGLETIVLKGTIVSAVVNIVLNFLLLGRFHQNGAAFTTLIAELIMCMYQYLYLRKRVVIKIPFRNILSIILGCLAIWGVSAACDRFVNSFTINLILKIALSVILYVAILLGFGNSAARGLIKSIKRS